VTDSIINQDLLTRLVHYAQDVGQDINTYLEGLLQQDVGRFFHLAVDMFCITDQNGRILKANQAFGETLGYTEKALVGQSLLDFVHPDDYDETLIAIKRHQQEDTTWSFENRYRHTDGTTVWLSWRVSPTTDGKIYAIARDITARKQDEQELVTRNEELDAFAYSVAHDVKNPIASMMGFASLMQTYYDRLNRETFLHYLNEIMAGGYQVREIVDSLLLLARVRQSDLPNLQPLDMYCIVEGATDRLKNQIIGKGAVIKMSDSWPTVIGYGPWLEQVWINYISNALKYGGQPPVVELGAEEDGDRVRFWVKDNGPGIKIENQQHLFKPFTRLDVGQSEGHGLGLSIVSRIVNRLGGQVSVESQPGAGSVFNFTLPRILAEDNLIQAMAD
jgi:PAS domain S-box-containing protein